MWGKFWKENRFKAIIAMAIIVFVLAMGMKSAFSVRVVRLKVSNLLGNHPDIQVTGDVLTRTQVLKNDTWNCAAINTSLYKRKQTVYELKILPLRINEPIALGICNKASIVSNNFEFNQHKITGKGCYFVTTEGEVYLSYHPLPSKSFKLGQLKPLQMHYDPIDNLLSYSSEDRPLYDTKPIQANDYVAVICFTASP